MKISGLLLAFVCLNVYGQLPLFNSQVHFKVEDGLPQSFVSGIEQDADGFVWVGTRGGIARYDGKNFLPKISYPADSSNATVVLSMSSGPIRKFLIHYEDEGYEIFDPLTQRNIFKNELAWAKSHRLAPDMIDSKGRWWMRTLDSTIVLANPSRNKFQSYNETNGKLLTLVEGVDGHIYSYSGLGINKYDSVRNTFDLQPYTVPFTGRTDVALSCALPDGQIALADFNSLILYHPGSKKFSKVALPGRTAKIRHLSTGPDGLVYVEAGGRVYRYLKNGTFQFVWEMPPGNAIERMVLGFLIDNTGAMWIGTNANGLYKVNLKTLPLSASPYQVNFHSDVLKMIPGFDGVKPPGWANNRWSYLFRYHYMQSGALICSFGFNGKIEVLKYEDNKWTKLPAPAKIINGIGGLTSVGDTIYAMEFNGGLWRWDNPSKLPVFEDFCEIPGMGSVVGVNWNENHLLVTSERSGIYKFKNKRLVKHYPIGDTRNSTIPFRVSYLTGIVENPIVKNRYYISTMGNGLLDWDIEKGYHRVITQKEGLPSTILYSVAADNSKRVWAGTNKGLSLIYPNEGKVYNFSSFDGLPGNEFNRSHVFKFPDGRLAFGGVEGFVVFNPDQFKSDDSNPKIVFTNLSIKSVPQQFGTSKWLTAPLNSLDQLVLPHDQNYLSISYAGISFGNPGQLTYRYKLEGYDDDWNYVGNGTVANYNGFQPGEYTFLVNAANTAGQWSVYSKKIKIRIDPPFWATWWAYALYAMILVLLLRTYLKFRENGIRMKHAILAEQAKAKNLEEMDVLKTRFFDNMTHELRTPLTLILTPLGRVINQPELSDSSKRNVDYAWKNANRLLSTVNQMLDISKTDSGKMEIDLSVGDLADFVSQCVNAFIPEAESKNITLIEDVQLGEGLYQFDADKWGKIIFNLLANALKFTEQGGTVKLEVYTTTTNGAYTNVCMDVTDNGCGISSAELPHIFERFYIANDKSSRKKGGTGIGLALVKELVQLLGGTIRVTSEVEKGSVFSVKIPATWVGSITEEPKRVDFVRQSSAIAKGEESSEIPLLLIVEDNIELRTFLIESLQMHWRVIFAGNGEEAFVKIIDQLPDLIISDVMMPVMDGFELCQKVKTDIRVSHIPILLLTAKAHQHRKIAGLQAGADDYLAKPFQLTELEQTIRTRLLHQERLRKHLQQEALPLEIPEGVKKTGNEFVDKLYEEMDKLIANSELTVDILAESLNLSRKTLGRKLKLLLDITPNELIRRYRLQKAAILLAQGWPATQVAYEVGFESPSYFSQCFKEQYGQTPSTYCQQV